MGRPSPNARASAPREGGGAAAREGEARSTTARAIWVDLLLYPTHSLPTAVAPVLVGVGLAIHDGVLAPLPALVAFLGSWVIHVAGVFTDNHELLRKHPLVPEHPELTRAVADGTLKLSTLRVAIACCLGLAFLVAPYLYRVGDAPVLALGAIGIAASLSYNGGPWAYVRRGLADPVFFLMFGVVAVVGTYYIQVAALQGAPSPWQLLSSLPLPVFLVGLPAGALVTSVMLIDDIRDREFDAAKGWRTGAVRRGDGWNRAEITLLVGFAYLAPIAFRLALGFDAWVLLPLATAPLAYRTVAAVRTLARRADLVPWTPRMAGLAALHSALLALGLSLSR
jgi:1,4-dihydroxy-2-naphthoate octaprenyltransferase